MANHIIEIDPFDVGSIIQAQREQERILKEFDEKVDRFLKEVAKIGERAAQSAYGNAVTVSVAEIENGYEIRADGKSVVFIEFGAGSAVNPANRYANEVSAQGGFEIRKGSYSDMNGGEYAQTGYHFWHFGGVQYTKVEPRNGMQKAYEAIAREMKDVAKAVFG